MTKRKDILSEINKRLNDPDKYSGINPYKVPVGFFDELQQNILDKTTKAKDLSNNICKWYLIEIFILSTHHLCRIYK